ncbi:MAG: GtrA family protein [Alphaproteobacteria bacterium]|nr:GtrA family protein [Alphaproteobacteria bacterium]
MVKQFVKYSIVGLGNTVIGLSLIYLAMGVFGLSPALSNFFGFALTFLLSFAVNRSWTFQSNAHAGRSLIIFAAICAVGYLLNLGAVLAAINLAQIDAYIAQLFGVAIYASFVFLGSRFVVFRG